MKKIILIISLLFLNSCVTTTENIQENNNSEIKELSLEEIKNTVPENEKIFLKEKNEEVLSKIGWDENIKFTKCDSSNNYENKEDFYKNNNIEFLREKVIESDFNEKYLNSNLNNIGEFCVNSSLNKYILWAYNDYEQTSLQFFKYDKNLNLLEKSEQKVMFSDSIYKGGQLNYLNHGDRSLKKYFFEYFDSKNKLFGFGLKNKSIIPFSNYGVNLTGLTESAPGIFSGIGQYFSQGTRDFCTSGLTPKGKIAICFVDIFYEYDYIKNEIEEKRICSYFINDKGIVETLEKCFDIDNNKNGYNLKSKAKGIDFYQDETGNLSIFDIDLNSAKISFGGVNIDKENSEEFEHFNRVYAKDLEYDWAKYNNHVIINGQFFTNIKDKKTALSFPLKSDGKIITDYVDNEIPKRTFVIDVNGNAKILEGYKKEYLENPSYKELIVAFTPEVEARKNSKIGRTYIGLKSPKNLIFFIAKDKNQAEMNKIISDYGIKKDNIIMMDGGPSSQFAYYENNGPGSEWEQFYGKWEAPHYFMIYKD